jgi:hypothetical protein
MTSPAALWAGTPHKYGERIYGPKGVSWRSSMIWSFHNGYIWHFSWENSDWGSW